MKNFHFEGEKENLIYALEKIMSASDAKKFINGFKKVESYLTDEEYIRCETSFPSFEPGMIGFLIANTNYFINLKAATFTIIALVLDITFMKGIASTALAISGLNSKSIVKLTDNEKCFVIEALKNDNRFFDAFLVFSSCRNDCLDCKFKAGAKCSMNEYDRQNTIKSLIEKNVFKEIEGGYKCNY